MRRLYPAPPPVKPARPRVDGRSASDPEVRRIFGELKSSVEEHVRDFLRR